MSTQKKGGGGWFSGALANLESRLDTILTEDSEASAKQRAAEEQAKANRQRSNSGRPAASVGSVLPAGSKDVSRTGSNDRLAGRLARAAAPKPPSRVSTPANEVPSSRTSVEWKSSSDVVKPVPNTEIEQPLNGAIAGEEAGDVHENGEQNKGPEQEKTGSSRSSAIAVNPAKLSSETPRTSVELLGEENASRLSLDTTNGAADSPKRTTGLQEEVEQMQEDYAKAEIQRQDEMHAYMEKLDALQAKLTYLAKETVAAAKEANASAGTSILEKRVAEKDEKIALLMQEGEKLSMAEMAHTQNIKKIRAKTLEDEATIESLKKKLEQSERSGAELKANLRRAQVAERQAAEKLKQLVAIDKQVEELRVDRENAAELVRSLTVQLKEAREQAAKAEKDSKASLADKIKIADLQNELEDAQIEKKLAEDRAAAEIKKVKEESQRQAEQFAFRELELKNEISSLDSRLEAMRSRAEEASSTGGADGGESSIKLMRQVDTLQQQYALAKGNWETIEGSLNARLAALEKERDEITRRESEFRKKAREVGARARKAEESVESSADTIKTLERELRSQKDRVSALQAQLEHAETAQADAKSEWDRQRKLWDSELLQRLEDEKVRWRKEALSSYSVTTSSRPESLATLGRKSLGTETTPRKSLVRLTSRELALHNEQRPVNRRASPLPHHAFSIPTDASPVPSRQESRISFEHQNLPPTPSIEIDARISDAGDFEHGSSPQRTLNELVSTSTAGPGPGPSVQLVERMSSLVRKLESEKSSLKDELSRLGAQRDEARSEVVDLMREVETKRGTDVQLMQLQKELAALQARYEASLEMLGEREEEVDELQNDVVELKRIYRELVETKVGSVS